MTQVCYVKQAIIISWRNWLGILIRKQAILELAWRRDIHKRGTLLKRSKMEQQRELIFFLQARNLLKDTMLKAQGQYTLFIK